MNERDMIAKIVWSRKRYLIPARSSDSAPLLPAAPRPAEDPERLARGISGRSAREALSSAAVIDFTPKRAITDSA